MRKSKLVLAFTAISLLSALFFVSCEKSTGSLGLDLVVDDKAVLGTKRTIPLVMYSETTDSIATRKPERVILGRLDDPTFGKANLSFVSQVLLSQTNPNFGINAVCDSAKLVMVYDGYYGDTNSALTIQVHELGEELIDDDSLNYYSNQIFQSLDLLGSKTFSPRPNSYPAFEDSITVPSIIVDINPSWVNNKIIGPANAGDAAFKSNDDFVKYLYGLKVSAIQGGNCTPYLDINSTNSVFRIYYREDPGATETKSFDLIMPLGSMSVNSSEFNYATAEFNIENQDTTNGESVMYVQSMSGVGVRIKLNGLENYKDSAFIINKAELIFKVIGGTSAYNEPPSSLLLLEEKNGVRILLDEFVPGELASSLINGGGGLEVGFLRDQKYVFNISSTINKYLNTENDINELVLIPAGSATNMNRVVLGGYQLGSQPAQFNLYFTRTDKK